MPSQDEIEEQIEKLLDQREALEEKCDTLDLCKEPGACEKCPSHQKILDLEAKVEELENKAEDMMAAEEGPEPEEEEEEEVKPKKAPKKAPAAKKAPKAKAAPKKKK